MIRRSVPPPVRFEEASDGESGLAMAARMHPGVIFLDVGMPGMGGDEVLQRLKADPGTAPIPVIVVTSHEIDEPLREKLAGASAILQQRELSVETLTRALVRLGE